MILIKQPETQKREFKENNIIKVDAGYLNYFLKRYKNIFSQDIYEYMNSLIHMESYVLNNNMIDLRERLMDIDIYRNIAGYNIYNHLYNTLVSLDNKSLIINKEDLSIKASIILNNKNYNFLTYHYNPNFYMKKNQNSNIISKVNILLYKEEILDELNQIIIYYEFLDKLGIKETEFKTAIGIDDGIFGIEKRFIKQYPETNINVLVKKDELKI